MSRKTAKAANKGKAGRSPLLDFAKWWRGLPNSWKAPPDLPPARRFEVEYLAFLNGFLERWRSDQNGILRELIERDHVHERALHVALDALKGWHRKTAIAFIQSEVCAMAKAPCGHEEHPLRRGGLFRGHLAKWLRDCRKAFRLASDMPLIVPPSAFFGCSPARQDLLPGVASFGFWSLQDLPWREPRHLALEQLADGLIKLDAQLAERLASELDRRWLARVGSGPVEWLDYLKAESKNTVWVAWSMFRLAELWEKPAPKDLDRRFVSAHLLAVSNGYRAALRPSFDPSRPYRDGDAKLADVYPILDLASIGPETWVAPDGSPDYPRLHRLCSYLWYASERIASEVAVKDPRKVRKNRAWVGPAFDFMERKPHATLSEIATHVGVSVSTVSRHPKIQRARRVLQGKPRMGHRDADGTVDAIAEDE